MVSLRGAVPDDAMAVAEMHVRSWQVGYRGLMPAEYLDALDPADWARRYTFDRTDEDRPATMLAVDDPGAVLGLATIGPNTDPSGAAKVGQLYALYVDPAAWGQGVGRLLLRDARERLSAKGFTRAQLWVMDGNERAQRFYRADGWRPDGRRQEEEVRGIRVTELCFRTSL
jgi:GNAT superfamily N-acetyltransferase